MSTKNILGLDLGTNSIGWAVVGASVDDNELKMEKILDAGSRILPMDAATQGDFARGNSISQTADRTHYRGVRRLLERKKLRRERLHRVLKVMGFLPNHYCDALDRYGKWMGDEPALLPWRKGADGNMEFIFKQAYDEMLALFRNEHPQLLHEGLKVPYDWTIYYLREKALTQLIGNEELAWVLLHFNQKRGYKPTRSEIKEDDNKKREEYYALKVIAVEDSGNKKGKNTWWNVKLENGMVYTCALAERPDWVGKIKEFIVTTQLDENGSELLTKDGEVKRSFRAPKEEDWGLTKLKTQNDIAKSGLTLGAYMFRSLLKNPKQKLVGELVRTIERDFYKKEMEAILKKQQELNPKLQDKALYQECILELYPQNDAYRNSIAGKDFVYLLMDDILLYHRPLKSKKSLIDDCPYESNRYTDKNGVEQRKPLKCVSKSHPLYQEFRLWQFIGNLRIYRNDDSSISLEDVTSQFLPNEEARVALFDYLKNVEIITQDTLLKKYFKVGNDDKSKRKGKGKNKGKDEEPLPYRWNYVQEKEQPANSTRGAIINCLAKKGITDYTFLDDAEIEQRLWHILYSVSDPVQLESALKKFAGRYNKVPEGVVKALSKCPPFESTYGAYSLKALKKLVPLMRMGKYWDADAIDASTRERINNILNGEVNEGITERVREKCKEFKSIDDFRALPLWMACYVVYNRHSEASDLEKWTTPDDIDLYLSKFKQHSMHNPIVEQVVTETLRTVRDVWRKHGHIDEIHLELGREMKNPADKRKEMSEQIAKNEAANLRIKALLAEFKNPEYCIENVIPYSPSQQERLRIYEESVLNNVDVDDSINDILKKFNQVEAAKRPTPSEIKRYKLWLEQKYVSPYTGQPIPLGRLFTEDYQIEHVIPQSRYFDDSLSNKVICEAEVNKLKDNCLGMEFIKKHNGAVVTLNGGRSVTLLKEEDYEKHVKEIYKKNPGKLRKLLMEDIPDDFIARQLNDSRYISRFIKGLLSKIVRTDDEAEATSKNLIVCTGAITDRLKHDWGVNDKWNSLILPRFKRLNEMQGTTQFTSLNTKGHVIPSMPLHLQRGFNKKRIDHRHHAMDAIVIACTTRQHVNLLNNEAAMEKSNINQRQLSHKLRNYVDKVYEQDGKTIKRRVPDGFILPWPSFPNDVRNALESIVVSFKQNLRVINKTSNYSTRYIDGKKHNVKQTLGDSWAIRKPMHKETVFGEVNLRKIVTVKLKEALTIPNRIVNSDLKKKIKELLALNYNEKAIKTYFEENAEVWTDVNLAKIEVYRFTKETSERYFATRKTVDETFTKATIERVTDSGIRKILLAHLESCDGDATRAFSPDGIDEMNRNIVALNGGKPHQPIRKVRWCESGSKFAVGETGNKSKKFVENAKGTNLFFAVGETAIVNNKTGETSYKRTFRRIPLKEAIIKMKQGLPLDEEAKFILSPGSLVYVPTEAELKQGCITQPIDRKRIYKMVSCDENRSFFIQHHAATVIVDKVEFESLNKMEKAITGEKIKEVCVPIVVNRLGEIIKIGDLPR